MASITYRAKVNNDGSLVISEEARRQLDLRPGDEVEISIHQEHASQSKGNHKTALQGEKQKTTRRKKILSSEEWEREWKAFSKDLSKVWPEGVSVADVISEMRR